MHDAFGRELKVGDIVVIPCRVKTIHASDDYCNADLELVAAMPPNMTKSSFSAINTRQTIRANRSDDARFNVVIGGPHDKLVPPPAANA